MASRTETRTDPRGSKCKIFVLGNMPRIPYRWLHSDILLQHWWEVLNLSCLRTVQCTLFYRYNSWYSSIAVIIHPNHIMIYRWPDSTMNFSTFGTSFMAVEGCVLSFLINEHEASTIAKWLITLHPHTDCGCKVICVSRNVWTHTEAATMLYRVIVK